MSFTSLMSAGTIDWRVGTGTGVFGWLEPSIVSFWGTAHRELDRPTATIDSRFSQSTWVAVRERSRSGSPTRLHNSVARVATADPVSLWLGCSRRCRFAKATPEPDFR